MSDVRRHRAPRWAQFRANLLRVVLDPSDRRVMWRNLSALLLLLVGAELGRRSIETFDPSPAIAIAGGIGLCLLGLGISELSFGPIYLVAFVGPPTAVALLSWELLNIAPSTAALIAMGAEVSWIGLGYLRIYRIGELLLRPLLAGGISASLVVGIYVATGFDIAAGLLTAFALTGAGVLAIRYNRLADGAAVSLASLAAILGCFWHTIGWTSEAPTWARAFLVLLALPPVSWIIRRLRPGGDERRQVARLRIRGVGLHGPGMFGPDASLLVSNRGHHEVTNLYVVYPAEGQVYRDKIARVLLPGDSVELPVGRYCPPSIELVFQDWSGVTWVHNRSFVVWTEKPRIAPPNIEEIYPNPDYEDGLYYHPDNAPPPIHSIKPLGGYVDIAVGMVQLRRGLYRVGMPPEQYLRLRGFDWPRPDPRDSEFF